MKLQCEVQVTNRLLPTLNLRAPGKSTFTQISIGRKPGAHNKDGHVFMMLCTAQNRNGTKYLLHNNVQQIFAKFINEGKATVRLSNPTDDIAFSKADPKQLEIFIKLLRLATDGKDFPQQSLSSLAPASAKQVEKPVTSLQIITPSQYPMTFPKSIQNLTIKNCSLRRISSQIMTLLELRSLDMSCNRLLSIPESFGQLVNIHTLNLSDNKLTSFPLVLCNSDISNHLASLDLRNNEIQGLPADIVKLKSLHSLNISYNQIKCVPETVAFLKLLRNIFMSDNKLEFLPGTMLTKMFETADFSNNPFSDQLLVNMKQCNGFPMPTLMELSARTIVTYSIWKPPSEIHLFFGKFKTSRVPYSNEDLDFVSIGYLKKVQFCVCGKPCFEASISRFLKMRIPSNVSYGEGYVPFMINFCSKNCQSRYH